MEPMLRFKADDGSDFPAWEEKALSEIAARVTRKNKGNQTDIPLTISSLDGLVDQRDYFKKTVASKDMSGYFLLRNGEFAYNKSYSVGFDYGSIKRLDKYPCGALSTLYICFGLKPNVKVDSGYLAHYFDSQKWNPEVAAICAEGARNHGLLNVPTADFFDINIAVPSLPEQRKIADLLSAVDDVIAAQEVEVAAWEKRKKGVMQKLFSQEVRFKADDGSDFPDWKEKTLGEIIREYREYHEKDGTYEHVSLTKDGVISKTERYDRDYLVKCVDKKYRVTHMNDICYNPANLKFGVICRNTYGDGIFSPIYVTYRVNESYDPIFIEALVVRDAFIQQALRFQEGTVYERMSVSPSDFESMFVSVPSLPEQRKIADCFTSLGDVIAKAKDELDAWRELKKGLLQQMFV